MQCTLQHPRRFTRYNFYFILSSHLVGPTNLQSHETTDKRATASMVFVEMQEPRIISTSFQIIVHPDTHTCSLLSALGIY